MQLRQLGTGVLLTVASSVLFGLAFPPTGWKPLAWLALAPFFVALRSGRGLRALLLTWLWCLGSAYCIGDWFPKAVASYFHQPMGVALALFFAVFTLMAGPYYMAFAWAYRALARHYRLALPFLVAAAWVGAELGRGRLFTGSAFFIGNPWGLAGYSQVDWLPLVQIAAVTGVYGISFALVCVNAALAELWIEWRSGGLTLRHAGLTLTLACLPGLGSAAYGWVALARADTQPLPGVTTQIAIVQGNLSVGSRWRSDLYGRNLDVYLRLTQQAAQQGEPRVVFWPEAAMTFFLETDRPYRNAVARVLEHDDLELVAGGVTVRGDAHPRYYNSIYVLEPDGSIADRYDKQHLVPFAEYFPLSVDLLRRRFGMIREFTAGASADPLQTRAGLAGVVVCNETMLPEVVAERVERGAVYLLNPTNDTWITDEKYTEQQFDIAVLRAIEQHRFLVRVSTAGPSAVIDPWGRAPNRIAAESRDVLLGELRAIEQRSVYGKVGDLFAFLSVAAVVAALAAPRLSRGAGSRPATR